jgi:hypothetical protein
MTIDEISILFEVHRPKQIGSLHEDDMDRLDERRQELEAQGLTVI